MVLSFQKIIDVLNLGQILSGRIDVLLGALDRRVSLILGFLGLVSFS